MQSVATWDLYVPTADPSRGTLASVTFEVSLELDRTTQLEYLGDGSAMSTVSFDWGEHLRLPWRDEIGAEGDAWWSVGVDVPGVHFLDRPFIRSGERIGVVQTSGPFDGTLDYDGFSGDTLNTQESQRTESFTYTDAATLAFFSVSATVIKLDLSTNLGPALWTLSGGDHNYSMQTTTANVGEVSISYTYE